MNQADILLAPARRANDYLTNQRRFREPEMLFDEFWREGELALFFGAAGTGKSIFAVQLADALSCGGGLHGFRVPRGRRRVLYVDLRHTDEQFLMRCAYRANGDTRGRPHTFPKNLFRDRPAPGQDLCEWLRAYSSANQVQAVIIDDLSAVKNTHDGTRETLHLMRRLRALRDELHISILVIGDSREPPRNGAASEADLGRSRVLCSAADSVFAAGRNRKRDGDHYLMQTRSRNANPFWEWKNAPVAHVSRTATGLLCFEFDERFAPDMDEEKRRLICKISRLHEVEYKTFREIALELGISKSWACDLYQKWTPAMDSVNDDDDSNTTGRECALSDKAWIEEDEPDESESDEDKSVWPDKQGSNTTGRECAPSNKAWIEEDEPDESETPEDENVWPDGNTIGRERAPYNETEIEEIEQPDKTEVSAIPSAAGPVRRSIYDLTLGHDGYGNEIYIESHCDHTGKPAVWYQLDKKGIKRRFTRSPLGIKVEHLDPGPFL